MLRFWCWSAAACRRSSSRRLLAARALLVSRAVCRLSDGWPRSCCSCVRCGGGCCVLPLPSAGVASRRPPLCSGPLRLCSRRCCPPCALLLSSSPSLQQGCFRLLGRWRWRLRVRLLVPRHRLCSWSRRRVSLQSPASICVAVLAQPCCSPRRLRRRAMLLAPPDSLSMLGGCG